MEAAIKVLVGGDCGVVPVGVICAMRMVESWYVTVERLARSKRAGRRRSRSRCRSLRVLPYLAKVCDWRAFCSRPGLVEGAVAGPQVVSPLRCRSLCGLTVRGLKGERAP